jgi:hypothetical protein
MRGTSLCSLAFILSALAVTGTVPGADSGRRHEIQFRRNDYSAAADPEDIDLITQIISK